MRNVSGAMSTHLGGNTTLASFVKVKRLDKMIFGFSDIDRDIPFDLSDGDGEIVYEANNNYSRSNIKNTAGFKVDNLEITGFLDSDYMTQDDMRAGLWDLAEYKFFMLNYVDTSMGAIKMTSGRFAKISAKEDEFNVELLGLMNRYSQTVVRPQVLNCLFDLGDVRCKIIMEPPDWLASTTYVVRPILNEGVGDVIAPTVENFFNYLCTTGGLSDTIEPIWNTTIGGTTADHLVAWETIYARRAELTVTGVTDNGIFTSTTGTSVFLEDHFTHGRVTWLTGNNVGLRQEITDHTVAGVFTLFEDMFFDVQVGDTFTAFAGCDKHHITGCVDKFDNAWNYGGFPYIPGNDLLFRSPDQPPIPKGGGKKDK